MWKILFKMVMRGWQRNPLYFIISMISLIVGLTCSVLLIGFVMQEYRIAHIIPDSERIFMIQEQSRFQTGNQHILVNPGNGNIGISIKNKYPEVENHCTFRNLYGEIKKDEKGQESKFYQVSVSFPEFFKPSVLAGDLVHALSDPSKVAVTHSFAMQWFGQPIPLGEQVNLSYSDGMVEVAPGSFTSRKVEEIVTIAAVIDDRKAGFLNFQLLKGLPDEALAGRQIWYQPYHTFVKLKQNISPIDFRQKFEADTTMSTQSIYRTPYFALPLNQVYLSGPGQDLDSLIVYRDPLFLYIGLSVALAILLISCFNYVNISMTRTLQRLHTTTQQLIFGATRKEIRMQLFTETSIQVIMAFGVALGIIGWILPVFNEFMNSRLMFTDLFYGQTCGVLLILLIGVAVLPPLYTCYKMIRMQPGDLIKKTPEGHTGLVTGMVIAQFAVSVVLLIIVMNIQQQMNFIIHSRTDAESVFRVGTQEGREGEKEWNIFIKRLDEIPEIKMKTRSSSMIQGSVYIEGKNMSYICADENYFDFYKTEFIAGRPFELAKKNPEEVVVNETWVKKNNIDQPIGHEFEFNGKYVITGVIKDFPVDHFSHFIQPLFVRYDPMGELCVKIEPSQQKTAFQKIEKLWKQIDPAGSSLGFQSIAQIYRDLHANEQRISEMLWTFTWISLLLTACGLFGLAWFSVEKRLKEIGIRKINGATEQQVIVLLCSRFIRWIMIAFCMALPFGIYITRQWMMQFVYRSDISVWTYVMVGVFIFLVGLLTVIWQSWRAAVVNPVNIIKSE